MSDYFPSVDVLIATRNEANHVTSCLESVFSQKYSKEKINIWVIDGLSDDGTYDIVKKLFYNRENCHLLANPKRIQSNAWNIAIEKSEGEIISIISAHSTISPDYIYNAVSIIKKTGAALVGGHMIAQGSGFIGKAIELLHHSKFGIGVGKFHDPKVEGYVDTVYTFNITRNIINKVGGFNTWLVRNQDIELSSRIRKQGGKIYLSYKLDAIYRPRKSLKGFIKQYFNTGKWSIPTIIVSPNSLSIRHFVPLLFVLVLCLLGCMYIFSNVNINGNVLFLIKYSLLLTIIIYCFTNIYYSLTASLKGGFQYYPLLLLLFPLLHLSYGFGTLFSIIVIPLWLIKGRIG